MAETADAAPGRPERSLKSAMPPIAAKGLLPVQDSINSKATYGTRRPA